MPVRRDRLHGPHLDLLAAAARPGAGLRLAGDVLAPPDRVGRCRGVRPTPPRGARPAGRARPAGLVAGQRGHHERARQARGPGGRKSSRSWQARLQAPSGLRWPWPAPGSRGDRCQRQRHQHVRGARGRRAAGPHAVGGGGAPDPARSTPTRATTATPTAPTCGGVGSPRGSPAVGSSPRPGWVGIAGGWSGRCHG